MKTSKIAALSFAVMVTGMSFSGCASKDVKVAELQKELENKTETISQQQALQAQKEAEIAKLKEELEKQQAAVNAQTATSQTNATASADMNDASLTPPNAKVGECYAKVLVPAQYETDTKEKLAQEKFEKLSVKPAEYKDVQYKILDKAESYKYVVKPATYKCVVNRVMVEPEKVTYKVIPATFKEVEEKVLVTPARQVWKKGNGPITKIDNTTGEIMCLVEEPAKYKTIKKKVIDQPARTEKVVIPAKYKNIRAKVVDQEASVEKVVIPATYKVVTVKELVSEPKINKEEVGEKFQVVETSHLVKPEELKWERILCKTNTNKEIIKNLQKELKERNYYKGPIDGIYGPMTQRALNAFQVDNNLPSGALTLESLEALGLK
jgi:hypothetical protein